MKAISLRFMGEAVRRPEPLPAQVPWLQSNSRLPPSGVVRRQPVAVGEGHVGMGTGVGCGGTEAVLRPWAAGANVEPTLPADVGDKEAGVQPAVAEARIRNAKGNWRGIII
jgi:hypothetical protein